MSFLSSVKGSLTYFGHHFLMIPMPAEVPQEDPAKDLRWELRELPPRRVDQLMADCFSCYAKGLTEVDAAARERAAMIADRIKKGNVIASEWIPLLSGKEIPLDYTHAQIPRADLLKEAVKTQITFDCYLLNLKKADRYRCLYEKIMREVALLDRVLRSDGAKVSVEEQKFMDQLKAKADAYGEKLRDRLLDSLIKRKVIAGQLEREVVKLTKGTQFTDASWSLVDFRNREVGVPEPRLQLLYPERARPIQEALKDYCVISVAGKSVNEGKFYILKRPESMPLATWIAFSSRKASEIIPQVKQALEGAKLNEIRQVQVREQEQDWSLPVCFESWSEVLSLHEERDVDFKTRRKVNADGNYERTNREETSNFIKDAARQLFSDNWSESRKVTAGVDGREAIALNRALIALILSGKTDQISWNLSHHLDGYFKSLLSNDVAKLPGSYLQDPVFLQALELQAYVHESLKNTYYPEQAEIPFLEKLLKTQYSWKEELSCLGILTQDIFECVRKWEMNLTLFSAEIDKPENRDLRALLGEDFLNLLSKLEISLEKFSQKVPSEGMKDLIAQRAEIIDRYDEEEQLINLTIDGWAKECTKSGKVAQALLFEAIANLSEKKEKIGPRKNEELERLWAQWKQGKSAQQIEEIISDSTHLLSSEWAKLTQIFAVLSAKLGKKRQDEVLGVVKNRGGYLYGLYDASIPPIFQNKAKLSLTITNLLGGELSPLSLQLVEIGAQAERENKKNELVRSRLSR